MIRLSGTAEEKLRHGEACPQTFAEHGPRHTDTTNTVPPGWNPGAASSRASRGDRPGAFAQEPRLAPLVRTKQRKNPFSAGPGIKGTVLNSGHSSDRPSRLHARAAKPADSAYRQGAHPASRWSISITRCFEPLSRPLLDSAEHDRLQPALPGTAREVVVREGHRSMTTRRMLLLKRRPAPGAPKKYSARPRGRPGSTAANQPAGRSMRSRVEPTDSMHHAIASVPAGDDHVLKSGSRTRLAEILSMASIVVKTARASSSIDDRWISLSRSLHRLSLLSTQRDSMPSRSIDASMEPSSVIDSMQSRVEHGSRNPSSALDARATGSGRGSGRGEERERPDSRDGVGAGRVSR